MERYYFCKEHELAEGEFFVKTILDRKIGGIKLDDKLYFILDYCPHAGAPICKGKVKNIIIKDDELVAIRCPWHNWLFNIQDGLPVIIHIKQKLLHFHYEILSNEIYIML